MANKYSSILRTVRARNVYEGVIAPPADLTIVSGDWVQQVLQDRANIQSVQSNFILRRLGIFSNFADGLVFKNANERINVRIFAQAYTRTLLTGTLQTTVGSKAVTGVGTSFTTEVFTQDILAIPASGDQYSYHIVDGDPADDFNLNLTDYAEYNAITPAYKLISQPSFVQFNYRHISELNYMYEIDEFFSPLQFATPALTDIVILAAINQSSLNFSASDIDFLTKSISTDFVDDVVHFDVVAELEFTRQ